MDESLSKTPEGASQPGRVPFAPRLYSESSPATPRASTARKGRSSWLSHQVSVRISVVEDFVPMALPIVGSYG
jgi:hypothetical protein